MAQFEWTADQQVEFKELAQKPAATLAAALVDKNKELADAKQKIAALEHRLEMFSLPRGGTITIN